MRDYVKKYIKESIDTKSLILSDEKLLEKIEESANVIINAYKNDKKVLVAGNGGSAADAQHIAAEFVSKFFYERQALSAIALTTNTSILTSIGNDYDHKMVFARQLQAHGRKGDIFIAISTSGASKNIVKATEYAKKCGLISIALTGMKKSPIDDIADYVIKVPSEVTPIIQESHIMVAHIICAIVEQSFNH